MRFRAFAASAVGVALLVAPAGAAGPRPRPPALPKPPRGFVDELVVGGLRAPTGFAVLPHGRVLVAELSGRVRLLVWGRLQPRPFLDLRRKVNSVGARGLMDVAVPRNFDQRRVVYLYYAWEDDARRPRAPKTMRLTRIRARGDEALPQSEVVLVGRRTCGRGREGVDCIPVACTCHVGGHIGFGRRGEILLSTGDGSPFTRADHRSLRAQGVDWLLGKVLRVNGRGLGLRDNPFWSGRARDNRSKVWATGLRNPWRFTVRPGSGALILGDVGWRRWEEIDIAARGSNLGWPCYEGPRRQPAFARFRICKRLYPRGARAPLWAYPRGNVASITGGVFVPGPRWPTAYRRAYVFADYARGVLLHARLDVRNRLLERPRRFATRTRGVVDLGIDRNGDLLYLSNSTGELRRIRFGPR